MDAAHFRLPRMTQLRRRLASMGANATASDAAGSVAAADDAASASAAAADDSSAFTLEQLTALRASGVLGVVLYTALGAAILWMTVLHFRGGSAGRKKIFHLLLLTSVLFNVPDPLGWILWPETESWVYTYPLRTYSVLLQSVCKSIISICWSEVVSAGQSDERRRVTYLVMVFNSILFVWALSVPFLLAKYPDNVDGQFDFMSSKLRAVVTYSGVAVIFIYGIILTYQGMRLRRRLLQAKGTVPIGSVEKSLSQLMLTVYVIVFSDVTRIVSLALNEANVDMPIVTFMVLNNLVPNIFPTICMLYLMRRVGGKKEAESNAKPKHRKPQFLSDDRESDLHNAPVLGMSKFSLPASRIASVDRVDLNDLDPRDRRRHLYAQQQQQQLHEYHQQQPDSRGNVTQSPTSHWVRK
jgi:hypothetical protein